MVIACQRSEKRVKIKEARRGRQEKNGKKKSAREKHPVDRLILIGAVI